MTGQRPGPVSGSSEERRWTRKDRPVFKVLVLLMPIMLIGGIGIAVAADGDGGNEDQQLVNCALVVPPDPLSAEGLATPYQLVGQGGQACNLANADTAAFVEGTVVDPASGELFVYNPLVVDQGQQPLVRPVVPQLPPNAVVGIWFGFNGDNLTLIDSGGSLAAGKCVNGLGPSVFGQFAHCNAPAFFQAANQAINAGLLQVPDAGVGVDGEPCPTTRDFSMVDQDQSDNVTTSYLFVGNASAQNTKENRAALGAQAQVQVNGSDNLLLNAFIDPALGCVPFKAPDLADGGVPATSLALNELQAAADQPAPVALVPPNNPFVQVDGQENLIKLNLYREAVNMPPLLFAGTEAVDYCQNMVDIQQRQLQLDRLLLERVTTPDPEAADTLFTFLAQRFSGSFEDLGCAALLDIDNPVDLRDRGDVVVDAEFEVEVDPLQIPPSVANAERSAPLLGPAIPGPRLPSSWPGKY